MDAKYQPTVTMTDQIKRYLDYLANVSSASNSIGAFGARTGDGNPIPTLVFLTPAETVIDPMIIDAATNPTGSSVTPRYINGNKRRVGVWQIFMCNPSSTDINHLIMGVPVALNDAAVHAADNYTKQTKFYTTLPLFTHAVSIDQTYLFPPRKLPPASPTLEPNVTPNILTGAFGNYYTMPSCGC